MTRMELNKKVRMWLYENMKAEVFDKGEVTILAARPHVFKFAKNGQLFFYDRWTWNVHVHGKSRHEMTDFVLVRTDQVGEVIDVFRVPYDTATRRKSIAAYAKPGADMRRGWINHYRLHTP